MRLTSSATGMTPFYEVNENCSRGGKPRQTENSNSAHKTLRLEYGQQPSLPVECPRGALAARARNGNSHPAASVFSYFAVNAIGPGVNPAGKVPDLSEPGFIQKLHRLGAPRSHLAKGHNLTARIELMHPCGQLRKRNKVPANIGSFVLVLVAHIE